MSGAIALTIQARRDFPRPLGRATELAEQSLLHVCDFQEPYLRTIVGFVGIADLHFVNAEPMDIIPDLREAAINAAVAKALALVSDRHWDGASSIAGVENLPQLKPASLKPLPWRSPMWRGLPTFLSFYGKLKISSRLERIPIDSPGKMGLGCFVLSYRTDGEPAEGLPAFTPLLR